MSDDFEEKFIKPITNACYPGTLAGLSLAVLQITLSIPVALKIILLTAALTFTLSAFSIFFYTIYPTRKKLWTLTAITFICGLCCSILAAVMLFVSI
jgi:uncharacterized membrane protein YciS (DUF1049 family)